jgi:DNA-binding CsgD family transcriptional regulator
MADQTPAAEACRFDSQQFARSVLNSLSAHIAILDASGVILEINEAWRRYGDPNTDDGGSGSVGVNYLAVCDAAVGDEAQQARDVAAGIRSVISGERKEFLYDYPCHTPEGRHWYYMRVIRVAGAAPVQVVVSHEEITALKLSEEALMNKSKELREQTQNLEEANTALKVLLRQREADKLELEEKVLNNLKELVYPHLERLKRANLKPRTRTTVELLDAHLKDIVSPFLQRISTANIILTPQEMQVASLVRDGKSSKEIADILSISDATVHFHRKNLRAKFGLKSRKANLRSFLLSQS